MSKVQSFHHIVFATKYRERVLLAEYREALFRFITIVCKSQASTLLRINGVEDHIHMLVNVNQNIALSTFVKIIKQESSKWARSVYKIPHFRGWCVGYAAFSVSNYNVDKVANYIARQVEHHSQRSFHRELVSIFDKTDLQIHEDDLR